MYKRQAYNYQGEPVTAADLKAVGAMAALLKDALKPNLIQTLEHTPAIVHGGPFANIAHGCNSVRATKAALKMADYTITEAGFGADLGAEKFFDIKCRMAGLKPDAVVLVATIRALKYNGGITKEDLSAENLDALKKGIVNLEKHIENLQQFGVPVVVTLNSFLTEDVYKRQVWECAIVTVPFSASSSCAIGLPTILLLPITTHSFPSIRISERFNSSMMPAGVPGTKPSSPQLNAPTL